MRGGGVYLLHGYYLVWHWYSILSLVILLTNMFTDEKPSTTIETTEKTEQLDSLDATNTEGNNKDETNDSTDMTMHINTIVERTDSKDTDITESTDENTSQDDVSSNNNDNDSGTKDDTANKVDVTEKVVEAAVETKIGSDLVAEDLRVESESSEQDVTGDNDSTDDDESKNGLTDVVIAGADIGNSEASADSGSKDEDNVVLNNGTEVSTSAQTDILDLGEISSLVPLFCTPDLYLQFKADVLEYHCVFFEEPNCDKQTQLGVYLNWQLNLGLQLENNMFSSLVNVQETFPSLKLIFVGRNVLLL